MNTKIFMAALIVLSIVSCNQTRKGEENHDGEDHEKIKFQYSIYTNNYELFAEADPFIVGETANILSHFSTIPEFKAVETGKMIIILSINGKEIKQTLDKPTRKGIYSFDIKPEIAGKGILKFLLTNEKGTFEIIVPDVSVFSNEEDAHLSFDNQVKPNNTNTTVFTKEQTWKIDFATSLPIYKPFGQIIKTTAIVEAALGNEQIIIAKTSGVVLINSNKILVGTEVSIGQALFSIIGGTADNNISVKFAEATSNYEKAMNDYERAKELSKDKIVSEKELQNVKNQYDNAKAVYDNLRKSFNSSGQSVSSTMGGFIKQVFVKNGSYVNAGEPLVTVSQNKTLQITAEVAQRYANELQFVQSANIRTISDNKIYSFEQLNGKVLSYGKSANADNYLIPIILQIDNKGAFINGSFVEVYLISSTGINSLSIPNTSLMEEQGVFFVWVQKTPELFEKREVHIGSSDGVNTEIKSGIATTERIVIRGATLIKLAQATGSLDAHSGHVH